MDHVPPDPPITTDFLAAFVCKCRWMLKHGNWQQGLLFRITKAHLDLLTQIGIGADGGQKEGKWTKRVRR